MTRQIDVEKWLERELLSEGDTEKSKSMKVSLIIRKQQSILTMIKTWIIPFPSLSAQETRTVISSSVKADFPSPINPDNKNESIDYVSLHWSCVTYISSTVNLEDRQCDVRLCDTM